jgi:3-oxoadipate enol-lactonase
MIGGTFAATYPDRIGSAVLMNCTASPAGTRQKVEYGLLLRMAGLMGGIRPPLTRSVLKAFLGPTTLRTRPDVVTFVRDSVQRVDVRSARWAVRSVVPRRPDQRTLLSRVTTPVLVVAGAEDATFPVPRRSRWPRWFQGRPSRCSTASPIWPRWKTLRWSTTSSGSLCFGGSFE